MHTSMLCVKTEIGTIVPSIYLFHKSKIQTSHLSTCVNTYTSLYAALFHEIAFQHIFMEILLFRPSVYIEVNERLSRACSSSPNHAL